MVAICPGLSRAARDGPGTQHAWSGAHAAFTAGGILEGSESFFAKKYMRNLSRSRKLFHAYRYRGRVQLPRSD